MGEILCPVCTEPTPDGLLCKDDTARLSAAIRALPGLMRELRISYTRQARVNSGNGGKNADTPLQYHVNSSEVFWTVTNTVSTWIRDLAESHGEELHEPPGNVHYCHCGDAHPGLIPPGQGHERTQYPRAIGPCAYPLMPLRNRMTSYSAWLLARMNRIRGHVAVEQIYDEITYDVRILRHAIDRPADQEYITMCSICRRGVYGIAGAEDDVWVSCRACKRVAERDEVTGAIVGYVPEYQVGPERERRLRSLRQQVLPEKDLLVAVEALLKEPLPIKTLRTWARRWQEGVVGRAAIQVRGCKLEGLTRDKNGSWVGYDRITGWSPMYSVEDALVLASRIRRPVERQLVGT